MFTVCFFVSLFPSRSECSVSLHQIIWRTQGGTAPQSHTGGRSILNLPTKCVLCVYMPAGIHCTVHMEDGPYYYEHPRNQAFWKTQSCLLMYFAICRSSIVWSILTLQCMLWSISLYGWRSSCVSMCTRIPCDTYCIVVVISLQCHTRSNWERNTNTQIDIHVSILFVFYEVQSHSSLRTGFLE